MTDEDNAYVKYSLLIGLRRMVEYARIAPTIRICLNIIAS